MSDTAVRCAECGLMGIRRGDGARKLIEAEWLFRQEGQPPAGPFETLPECRVRAGLEWREFESRSREHVKVTIARERTCHRFTTWIPGLSPNKHLKMIELEKLKQLERDEAERNRTFQKEQLAAQHRHNWRTLSVSLAAVLVSFVGLCLNAFKSNAPPVINVQMPANAEYGKAVPQLPANEPTAHKRDSAPDVQSLPSPGTAQ